MASWALKAHMYNDYTLHRVTRTFSRYIDAGMADDLDDAGTGAPLQALKTHAVMVHYLARWEMGLKGAIQFHEESYVCVNSQQPPFNLAAYLAAYPLHITPWAPQPFDVDAYTLCGSSRD